MSALRIVGLRAIVDGATPDLHPTVLHTTDGQPLLYPGINTISGEPGTGKTLLAEAAAAETLTAGGAVVMLDWEDRPVTFIERMRALGIADEILTAPGQCIYANVDGAFDDADRDSLRTLVEVLRIPPSAYQDQFDLIVSDDLARAAIEHHITYGALPAEYDNEEAAQVVTAYSPTELNDMTIGIRAEVIDDYPTRENVDAADRCPVLVIVDGWAAALAADSIDENDNGKVTAWTNSTLRPLAERGAVVVILDHVVKDPAARTRGGRGAGAKLALVDGAAYELRAIHPFARGQAGTARLVIAKDRPGLVGPFGTTAAIVHFDPTDDGLTIRLEPAEPSTTTTGEFRPTVLMERISTHLARVELAGEQPPSGRDIENDVEGKSSALRAGIRALVEEGYLERIADGRANRYRSVRDFRANTPNASPRPQRVPIASRDAPNPTRPRVPPLYRGDAGRGSGPPNPTDPPTNASRGLASPDEAHSWPALPERADPLDEPPDDEPELDDPPDDGGRTLDFAEAIALFERELGAVPDSEEAA